jgi:hypothetical protein
MGRAMNSPIPIPCCLVVKKGSRLSASFSGGFPGAESKIETIVENPPFNPIRPIIAKQPNDRDGLQG